MNKFRQVILDNLMLAATIGIASEKQAFKVNQYEIRLTIDALSKKGNFS